MMTRMKKKKLVRKIVPRLVQGPASVAPCAATGDGADCYKHITTL